MSYSPDNLAELDVLMLYRSPNSIDGIKLHKTASPGMIAAARRLYEAGFITQVDGGYLTSLGTAAAEHAHLLYDMLNGGAAE